MKYVASLIFLGILLSCNVNKSTHFKYTQDSKSLWIDSYKYEVFYGCMTEGLGNDNFKNALYEKDLFNPNSELDFKIIDNARAFGKLVIEKMPSPFIKADKGEDAIKKKNFISSNCLRYYASGELDSIANKEYENYLRQVVIND